MKKKENIFVLKAGVSFLLGKYGIKVEKRAFFASTRRNSKPSAIAADCLNLLISENTRTGDLPEGVSLEGSPRTVLQRAHGIATFLDKGMSARIWMVDCINFGISPNLIDAGIKTAGLSRFHYRGRIFSLCEYSKELERGDWNINRCRSVPGGGVHYLVQNKNIKEMLVLPERGVENLDQIITRFLKILARRA